MLTLNPTRAPSVPGPGGAGSRPTASGIVAAVAAERTALVRYASHMTGSEPEGAAFAGRVIDHALERSDRLADGADTRAWLYQIAYHLVVEDGRHHESEVSLGGTERLWRDGAYGVDVGTVVERSAAKAALGDAVLRLPVHYRNVVVLHDALGWSVEEIAGMLGVAAPAARDRLRRARMMLVSALDDRPDGSEDLDPPLSCADARTLVSWLIDDELGAGERVELAMHLADCPTCSSLHQALVAVSGALGGAASRPGRSGPPPRSLGGSGDGSGDVGPTGTVRGASRPGGPVAAGPVGPPSGSRGWPQGPGR